MRTFQQREVGVAVALALAGLCALAGAGGPVLGRRGRPLLLLLVAVGLRGGVVIKLDRSSKQITIQ
jgi:hypothetical protein